VLQLELVIFPLSLRLAGSNVPSIPTML